MRETGLSPRRIFMAIMLLALSLGAFWISGSLALYAPFTLLIAILLLFAAVGALFGYPERGALLGFGWLLAFLGMLIVTANWVVALLITVALGLSVWAFLFWHRMREHGR